MGNIKKFKAIWLTFKITNLKENRNNGTTIMENNKRGTPAGENNYNWTTKWKRIVKLNEAVIIEINKRHQSHIYVLKNIVSHACQRTGCYILQKSYTIELALNEIFETLKICSYQTKFV